MYLLLIVCSIKSLQRYYRRQQLSVMQNWSICFTR